MLVDVNKDLIFDFTVGKIETAITTQFRVLTDRYIAFTSLVKFRFVFSSLTGKQTYVA